MNYKLFVSQSEVKPKLIVIPSHRFSCALPQLHVFTIMRFDWFTGLSVSFVIDETDYFQLVLVLQQLTETCFKPIKQSLRSTLFIVNN